jgi:flagellar assembly protein FliH
MSCEPLVLRGAAAGAARPVTFGHEPVSDEVLAAGPWADVVDRARSAGHRAGYRVGLDEGRRAGLDEGRREVVDRAGGALDALDRAAERLARLDAADAGQHAPRVVELAIELTRLLLQRELEASADPAREAVARALPLAPDRGPLVVRLNPQDCEALGDPASLAPGRDVTVVPDPSLASGDAVVDVGPCRVESRLDEALDRVARALRAQGVQR